MIAWIFKYRGEIGETLTVAAIMLFPLAVLSWS